MIKKVYNSAAAFALGDAVYTETSSGCLRQIVLSAHGIRGTIAQEYMQVGALHEELHAKELGSALDMRELPIQRDIGNGVIQSGRMDFVLKDGTIHETKATFSDNIKRKAIGNGEPKLNHLAQLVSYLINRKQALGALVYGYYEAAADGSLVQKAKRQIETRITSEGGILIDGAVSEWSVEDQLKHTELAAKALRSGDIPPRPINADDGFASPCRFCDYRAACDKYDAGEGGTFFDEARRAVASIPPQIVKIKRAKK